jgi:cellulose 1,4-beta-cellobiosidase
MLDLESDTSLAVDTLIRVKVRARNGKGWGSFSELNSAGATMENIPSVMSPPTIVSSSITNTLVPLTWTAPTGVAAGGSSVSITTYDLERSPDGSTWTSLVTGLTTTSYSDSTVTGGNTYYYNIKPHNKYGAATAYSAASVAAFTSQAPSAPNAPVVA